jgi:hypothetical protein
VHVPQGFTYAIAKTDYRGYANLQAGATAIQNAFYYFQGSSQTGNVKNTIKGVYDKEWQHTHKVPVDQLVWGNCGERRNFNINTDLQVKKGTDGAKTSFIAMDSTDGSIKTTYHFAWKTCP